MGHPRSKVLTQFSIIANVQLLHPLKCQKTKGFVTFSGSIEIAHWARKGKASQ